MASFLNLFKKKLYGAFDFETQKVSNEANGLIKSICWGIINNSKIPCFINYFTAAFGSAMGGILSLSPKPIRASLP